MKKELLISILDKKLKMVQDIQCSVIDAGGGISTKAFLNSTLDEVLDTLARNNIELTTEYKGER